MINLLPYSVVEHLADRIAKLLRSTLQARLQSGIGGGGGGGAGHGGGGGSGGSRGGNSGTFGGMFSNFLQSKQQAGSGNGASSRNSSASTQARSPQTNQDWWRRDWGAKKQTGSGSANRARGTATTRTDAPRSGLFDRLADWYGQRQAKQATGNQGQDWWRRGWGNRTQPVNSGSQGNQSKGSRSSLQQSNQPPSLMQRLVNRFTGGSGGKKSAFARASRLKIIAQRRLGLAKAAVKASNKQRGQAGWHPAAHGNLLANQRAAQQKVAQATALQARATGIGAAANSRVATGLSSLATKIPLIGTAVTAFGIGIKAGIEFAKIPNRIADSGDARIDRMRSGANFSGQITGALAGYDLKTQLRQAQMARGTSASGAYLIEQQNKLQDALQPYREAIANAQNAVMGKVAEKAAKVLDFGIAAVKETAVQAEMARQTAEWAAGVRPWKDMQSADEIRAEMKEMERQKKMKPLESAFDMNMNAWAASIDHKKEARQNNKPRPPLAPIR